MSKSEFITHPLNIRSSTNIFKYVVFFFASFFINLPDLCSLLLVIFVVCLLVTLSHLSSYLSLFVSFSFYALSSLSSQAFFFIFIKLGIILMMVFKIMLQPLISLLYIFSISSWKLRWMFCWCICRWFWWFRGFE